MSEHLRSLVTGLRHGRVNRREFLRRAVLLGLTAGAANALAAACAPSPAPTAAPAAPGAAGKPDANALDKLVEAAKKEGEVAIIEAVSKPTTVDALAKAFRKKWGLPDSFKVTDTVKPSGDVVAAVSTEVKAGKVANDIAWVVGVELFKDLRKAGELLSYEPAEWAPNYKAKTEQLGFEYEPGYYYPAQMYTFNPVWNKQKVKKELASWDDLLELGPAYKGRIIVADVRNSSSHREFYVGVRRAKEASFYQKLKDLYSPVLIFRVDEMITKITAGEIDLTTGGTYSRAYQAWQADKSLDLGILWPKEGLAPLPTHMGILAKAPHPNAAKLMVEYLLSQEWMQNWVNLEAQWPVRSDYKIEGDVAKFMKHADQVSWISVPWAKITTEDRQQATEEFRKIFG